MFAQLAASVPVPEEDILFVWSGAHSWAALDEQAVCASQLGLHLEAFSICRQLLTHDILGLEDRIRIAENRDFSVPALLDIATTYPPGLIHAPEYRPDADVTVTVSCGPSLENIEATLNSVLNSCTDRSRVSRFLVDDSELDEAQRATLHLHYPLVESLDAPFSEPPAARLRRISDRVETRFWLHIPGDWRFFAPERLLSRLADVLDAEPDVVAVAVNYEDATALTGRNAPDEVAIRRAGTGRYVLTKSVPRGPAMFDTERLSVIGGIDPAVGFIQTDLTTRAQAAGLRTASLDEVLCVPV
jgi:hypothetical protein